MKKYLPYVFLISCIFQFSVLFHISNQKKEEPIFIPPSDQVELEPLSEEEFFKLQRNIIFQESKFKDILTYLASDELEGRMSGKKGNVTAANYIKEKFKSFGLDVKTQPFRINRMNPGPHNEVGEAVTSNIIGILKGKKDECIVVGAHMDHIGYGPQMSRDGGGEIHNGADDNASGTTAVLKIAETFSKLKPNYTYVFICFSAEEMGLLGSNYYVRNPVIPNKIKLMVNFDMVGWYKDKKLQVLGGSGINFVQKAIDQIKPQYSNLNFVTTPECGGGSDQASFSNVGIPSVFVFTGLHPYYHTSQDDVEKIDFDGLTKIASFAFDMLKQIDNMPEQTLEVNYIKTRYPLAHDHGTDKFSH